MAFDAIHTCDLSINRKPYKAQGWGQVTCQRPMAGMQIFCPFFFLYTWVSLKKRMKIDSSWLLVSPYDLALTVRSKIINQIWQNKIKPLDPLYREKKVGWFVHEAGPSVLILR